MTWADFLKYSKYIAVFYAAAFVIGIVGIWAQPHAQWIWSAVMFFGAAIAANVALGFYQANHKSALLFAKNDYLAKQEEAQVITGDGKSLAIPQALHQVEMEEFVKQKVEEEWDRRRYR